MKSGRFHHTVKIEVELTGLDLTILEYHAKKHYDGACQRFFESARDVRSRENDGYVWMNQWQWEDWKSRFGDVEGKMVEDGEYRHPSENPDLAVTVTVSSRNLDLCLKIIERLGADDSWTTVEYLTGIKMPPVEKKMSELVVPLRESLREAFDKIQREWKRLEEEAAPAPEFDGQLLCPHCHSDEIEWQEYVLATRQILGVRDGELAVDLASEKSVYESTKDEMLSCKACFCEFKIPAGLTVDHIERHEFERSGS